MGEPRGGGVTMTTSGNAMNHRNDEQFLLIPEPNVPWKSVRLAEFDASHFAAVTKIRNDRNVYLDTYDVCFQVSGQMVSLMARHSDVREKMLDLYLNELRSSLTAIAR
jgi:hypothetical protein